MARQSKTLVLLITDQAIQLLVWLRGSLVMLGSFQNTQDDHEAFVVAIREYPDYPVLVVADLIDESFRHSRLVSSS